MRQIAVFDIGKTNLKLALVDLQAGTETAIVTAPNRSLSGPPWLHFDVDEQQRFLLSALAKLASAHRIDGIVVTTHGACGALLDADGALAAPVMDYEDTGLDRTRPEYDALRPSFAQTGSPALPMGLNLGAQLHHMLTRDPTLRDRIAHVVTWPQYWGYRLTGQLACDLCSLGCHTDLWDPLRATWSDLPDRLGLAAKMANPRAPGDVLGMLSPEVQAATGLSAVPVLVGIHDSNASLVPYLAGKPLPFAVVSTGTWVIAMAMGGRPVTLDPTRDTLLNVNALGQAVPSARFMGGREYDVLLGPDTSSGNEAQAHNVLQGGILCLPSVIPGSGPFPHNRHRWTGPAPNAAERAIATDFYLALMTAECLTQIGACGPVLVEGPFAANTWFLRMLASASGQTVLPSAGRTGTSIGAACLFARPLGPQTNPVPARPLNDATRYIAAWRDSLRAAN